MNYKDKKDTQKLNDVKKTIHEQNKLINEVSTIKKEKKIMSWKIQ